MADKRPSELSEEQLVDRNRQDRNDNTPISELLRRNNIAIRENTKAINKFNDVTTWFSSILVILTILMLIGSVDDILDVIKRIFYF